MNPAVIFTGYLRWYYGKALSSIGVVWKNFLWFTGHFFSFSQLLKTLFSPWKRMGEEYQDEGFHPGSFFETLLVNILMRVVGVFIRLFIIIIGIFFFLLTFLGGLLFIVFWVVAPLMVPLLVITGFALIGF